MQFISKSRYVRFSPHKLRVYVDVIRGKNVEHAINWLKTCPIGRVMPIQKMLQSAAANAKHEKNIDAAALIIKDIRVDEGPMYRYYRPGAMGRANIQRRRFSHMRVTVQTLDVKKD